MNTKQALEAIETHLRDGAEARLAVLRDEAEEIVRAAELIADKMSRGGKLLLCGNGGSAADCQHMATEFTCRLTRDFIRPALPAIALTTDTSCLTAAANDNGFDSVFARQVDALGKEGDILIAISTSGGSPNILRAVEIAQSKKISVVALCGEGGALSTMGDVNITVPCKNNQIVQECHLAVEHLICHIVERILFAS